MLLFLGLLVHIIHYLKEGVGAGHSLGLLLRAMYAHAQVNSIYDRLAVELLHHPCALLFVAELWVAVKLLLAAKHKARDDVELLLACVIRSGMGLDLSAN